MQDREKVIKKLSEAFFNNLQMQTLENLTKFLEGYACQIYSVNTTKKNHCESFNPFFRIMINIKELRKWQTEFYVMLVDRVGMLHYKINFSILEDRNRMIQILSFRNEYGRNIKGVKGKMARKILLDVANTHFELNDYQTNCNVGLVFKYAPSKIFRLIVEQMKNLQDTNATLLILAELVDHKDMNALISRLCVSHLSWHYINYESTLIDKRNFTWDAILNSINFDLSILSAIFYAAYFTSSTLGSCVWAESAAFIVPAIINMNHARMEPFAFVTAKEALAKFTDLIEARAAEVRERIA